ncbi:L-ascorbate metabolism protein UlaG, beta-lactamase superfamily [Hathewaya proteolytica DSM 3090]|uniref:L-ascorbate metabolism protein UlaG, beta-lactamase superfamily n=1 Tax=Hathewaya proteolytica DSM 3090 TaxID=1121331 RepID=A0A1M6RM69_9CLOT|nr:MBL fold metallo-hydrolase [Hathewaya proteolytica]SHK33529.1 L-ascorbate metabolism protein UlaG, beta-lactamase superfamily [Hathewaya proteolytica DSM 3090]
MNIKWFGHSSFLITSNDGFKILTDPFPNTIGYKTNDIWTNVVTISHHHFDHNCLEYVKGDYVVLDKVGETLCSKTLFTGHPSYHDNMHGTKRGLNTIFTFSLDNINFCHLGDLGYIPTKDEIKSYGEINVLFIPVGGNYTIDSKEAAEVCRLINPNIIIPMHYKTPALNFDLDNMDDFLLSFNHFEKVNCNSLELDSLQNIKNKENKVFILEY